MSRERIICGERHPSGYWVAWLADMPQNAIGGGSAVEALSRILATMEPPCDLQDIWPLTNLQLLVSGSFEFAVGSAPCPDCKGSGRYVGFQAVEPCGSCEGRGRVRLQQDVARAHGA